MLAAVRQNGQALRWASAELKSDRGAVVAAVREAGMAAYELAPLELQKDPEVAYTDRSSDESRRAGQAPCARRPSRGATGGAGLGLDVARKRRDVP